MDIIIRPDQPHGPGLPNHPDNATYDPRVAQDHTGVKFNARPRKGARSGDPLTDATVLMQNPQPLACPNCGRLEFRITADDSRHAAGGLIQLECAGAGCKTFWPILQVGQPQLTDSIVRRAGGIVVPDGQTMTLMDMLLGGDDD